MKFVVSENTFGCHPSYVIDVPEGDIRKAFPSPFPYTPEEFAKRVKPLEVKDLAGGGVMTSAMLVKFLPSSPTAQTTQTDQLAMVRDELLRTAEALAMLLIRFEKRGVLVDHYVTALAEIADGGENPVEIARQALWEDPNRPAGQDRRKGA